MSIIANADVIAVNQDPLSLPAQRRRKTEVVGGDLQLWSGPLASKYVSRSSRWQQLHQANASLT